MHRRLHRSHRRSDQPPGALTGESSLASGMPHGTVAEGLLLPLQALGLPVRAPSSAADGKDGAVDYAVQIRGAPSHPAQRPRPSRDSL
jgi:hypothetical protein